MFLKGLFESILAVPLTKKISGLTSNDLRMSVKNHCLEPIGATPKSYVHTSETSDPLAT